MQVVSRAKPVIVAPLSGEGDAATRNTLLSLYGSLPYEDISIEEFERLALERLRVLKGIEDLRLRGKKEDEIASKTKELTDKHLLGANNKETFRIDQLSHFILRLSYCSKPELRKWFITQECELFKIRFSSLLESATDKSAFMKRENLDYHAVSSSEIDPSLKEKLRQTLTSCGDDKAVETVNSNPQVYRVPFTSVPDLVSQRKVFLSGGFAYVCQKDLASLVVQDFRSQLSKGLSQINRRWREVFPDSDQRLRPLVEGLSQRYLGPDLGSTTQQRRSDLTPANLNAVATRHFPLCMQQLMVSLRRDHHLRHNGRQQLSLFLKAIGLPLEDAMVFWRSEFAPKIPADKFDKEYAYNIRHNYGKEGKMTEYTAHNCVSIIRMSGGTEDHHGCPYRRMDEASLRANLAALSCSEAGVNEAMQKKAQGHFQIACACAFQGIHKAEADLGINHPAQYYSESRRVYDEREAAAVGSKTSAALPSSS